jgi:hypothetical protein
MKILIPINRRWNDETSGIICDYKLVELSPEQAYEIFKEFCTLEKQNRFKGAEEQASAMVIAKEIFDANLLSVADAY